MKKISVLFFLLISMVFVSGGEISARTAWIREFAKASNKEAVIRKGLASKDPEVRAHCVYRLFMLKREACLPELKKRIPAAGLAEGRNLVICARMIKDPAVRAAFLSEISAGTTHPEVAKEANRSNFPFFRKNIRLSERRDWDFEIVKLKSIPLPTKNWEFIFDDAQQGHLKGYHRQDFASGNWKKRGIGYWKGPHTGWYRIRFTAPEKKDANAIELHFAGVEEAAWVWVNGKYIGCRDKGPKAWNQPFWLDMTSEIRWGRENVFAIRVINTGDEGGMYKPVSLDILK